MFKHASALAWVENLHRLMVFAPTCSILIEFRRPRKWKILHRLMVFTFSISTLYDDDLVCMRQKPAQAHGFCILWLSTIGLQSCLGGTETCTGTWFLHPVVQPDRTMIDLGSGKTCTGTWFLGSLAKTDMAAIVSGKDRKLHKLVVFYFRQCLFVSVCLSLSVCLCLPVSVSLSLFVCLL